MFDAFESDVTPVDTLHLAGQSVQAQQTEVTLANRELLPWLAALGLLLILVEWWVYNAKVRI